MKTVCFTLGLLLLTVCCCDAQSQAMENHTIGSCCFTFSTRRVPSKFLSDITKTDHRCLKKAFIVTTVGGKQICYSQTFQWALNLYKKVYNTKGSDQHH